MSPRRRSVLCVIALLIACAFASPALAVRPFITDDARVVGGHQLQVETWVRADREAFQHWLLLGYGPVGPVELTVGMVHGAASEHGHWNYSIAGPLLQAKLLLWEPRANRWPGLAVAGGFLPPSGIGTFAVHGWDFFEYVAITESLGDHDRVLLHANVGAFGSTDPNHLGVQLTWGVGAQVRVYRGFNLVGEVFSGDPYLGGGGGATQMGFRYIFSDNVQLDGTVGVGLWGSHPLPPWGTLGLRLATNRLY